MLGAVAISVGFQKDST